MSFSTIQEIIQFAIAKEKDAQTFYRSAATLARYPGISGLFLELADEEGKHQKMLEELPDPSTLPMREYVPDLKISDYLIDLKFNPEMNYQEVMILAMKNEEKSLKFYQTWEAKTQDPDQKKLLGYLAGEEARHKYRLEAIYDKEILD
jgi:rubrerythrin